MSGKPIIGIPCYQDTFPAGQRPRLVQYQTYTKAVMAGGGIPMLMPLETGDDLRTLFDRIDGLLLSGGDDINPKFYGEERYPKTEQPDDLRDEVEFELTRMALAEDKPLLAICRGIQALNVAMGGTLIQHIADMVPNALKHEHNYDDYRNRQHITHEVEIEPGSRLASIIGTHAGVNSFHHQALKQIAPIFRPVACAPDGIVEAMELPDKDRFVVAVQWHPEDMFHTNDQMLSLFKAFVNYVQERG
ncbi:MAG: gamma-glutamyl-gamma-aminobutyrate hydrolase family protein [Anaerolineae bacterium]|nr:gamma-glutamyl-gamma-aminobutyrate hydrolase family protein [Anaerolineae bacterium]